MEATAYLVVAGMAAITYAVRVIPFILFADHRPPDWVRRIVRYLPPAILGALLAVILWTRGTEKGLKVGEVVALLVTAAVARATKNLALSVTVGLAVLFAAAPLGV